MVEDEADDAIATAIARFGADPRLEQIVICSVDKDLSQLVDGDRIVLRDRMRRVTYDEAGVVEKFGVSPASIPTTSRWWATAATATRVSPDGGRRARPPCSLAGSTSTRSAVGAGLGRARARNASRLAATLEQQREAALLYRTLATLNRDSAIEGATPTSTTSSGVACRTPGSWRCATSSGSTRCANGSTAGPNDVRARADRAFGGVWCGEGLSSVLARCIDHAPWRPSPRSRWPLPLAPVTVPLPASAAG